jgi:hypothetical protein
MLLVTEVIESINYTMTKLLTYLTALLILITRPRARQCDGDLIQWETKQINGRTVTMIRWL